MGFSNSYFLRVHGIDADSVTLENRDGGLFPLPDEAKLNRRKLSVGDVLHVEGESVKVASRASWSAQESIGVVRAVDGDSIVVESGSRFIAARSGRFIDLRVGNSVRLDARMVVVSRVQETPLQIEPLRVGRDDDDFDAGSFIVDSRKAGASWADFGGLSSVVERAKALVNIHFIKRREVLALGVTPVRGVIFSGPPGTGKTFLAKIIASEADATLYVVTAAQLGGRLVGESEMRLEAIYAHAAKQALSLVFIDEIDSITTDRGSENGSHSSRLVQTFLTALDGYAGVDNVVTVGTTNRLEDLDPALRRHGRFGFELVFYLPAEPDRLAILLSQQRGKHVGANLPLKLLAKRTEGWSAAELDGIWLRAAELAVSENRQIITGTHMLIGYESMAIEHSGRHAKGDEGEG